MNSFFTLQETHKRDSLSCYVDLKAEMMYDILCIYKIKVGRYDYETKSNQKESECS